MNYEEKMRSLNHNNAREPCLKKKMPEKNGYELQKRISKQKSHRIGNNTYLLIAFWTISIPLIVHITLVVLSSLTAESQSGVGDGCFTLHNKLVEDLRESLTIVLEQVSSYC
jgi:hypothetical protein